MQNDNCRSDMRAQARPRITDAGQGLFAGHEWRISPAPFPLGSELASELENLGRVLLQFNRAVNLLYRKSVEGKQPAWVAEWLERGKPRELIELQRRPRSKTKFRASFAPTCC